MIYEPELIYHVYNRGNNRRNIFLKEDNYAYFLEKVRKHICPHADILCYCLMLNHFHFLLRPKVSGCTPSSGEQNKMQPLSRGFRTLLSSYTRAINAQENWTGSLFQQKTKVKAGWGFEFDDGKTYSTDLPFGIQLPYVIRCFRYIHRNPIQAGLVKEAFDWPHSSAMDYVGLRDSEICNYELTEEMLGIRKFDSFESYLEYRRT